jgi:hypothetical protein
MFRHITSDEIVITPENTISDVLKRGTSPLEKFYKDWDVENFKREMDKVMNES